MNAKKILANGLKFVLFGVVAAFLALHSINLFKFVFPPEQDYYAWLGFGLTGFAAIVYLVLFLWGEASTLQRTIALIMMVVCGLGEVLAAIFGMQIEAWSKAGFTMTEKDFNGMLLIIGILGVAHFLAMFGYFAGDKIKELLGDADGDGIRNFRDPDYVQPKPAAKPVTVKAADTQNVQTVTMTVDEYMALRSNGHEVKDPTTRQR